MNNLEKLAIFMIFIFSILLSLTFNQIKILKTNQLMMIEKINHNQETLDGRTTKFRKIEKTLEEIKSKL